MPPSRRSPFLFNALRRYLRRYIARHFHALRVSRGGPIPELPNEPVLMVLNHPSWWDPLIGLALTEKMPAGRVHYGPIESRGLAQYPFLEKVGFFGVDSGSPGGALKFLRESREILSRPESVLWITAQGRFTDCRERPPGLKEGVGHLVHRLSNVRIIPLALEYPYWNDRCPEALVRFGDPIEVEDGRARPPLEWTAVIEEALQSAQDRLEEEARHRDPGEFDCLLGGSAGVGGVYDGWRRFKAMLGGRKFRAEHQAVADSRPESSPSPPEPEPARSPRESPILP